MAMQDLTLRPLPAVSSGPTGGDTVENPPLTLLISVSWAVYDVSATKCEFLPGKPVSNR